MNTPQELKQFVIDENKRVTRLWNEVQAKTGVQTGLPVKATDPVLHFLAFGHPPGPNFGISKRAMSYNPGTTEPMSDEMISGVLAHELSHYLQGFTHGKKTEYLADTWATQQGYGEGLLAFFDLLMENFGPEGGDTHPSYPSRISNIKQVMSEMAQSNREAA